jgi:hypothetical protein
MKIAHFPTSRARTPRNAIDSRRPDRLCELDMFPRSNEAVFFSTDALHSFKLVVQ